MTSISAYTKIIADHFYSNRSNADSWPQSKTEREKKKERKPQGRSKEQCSDYPTIPLTVSSWMTIPLQTKKKCNFEFCEAVLYVCILCILGIAVVAVVGMACKEDRANFVLDQHLKEEKKKEKRGDNLVTNSLNQLYIINLWAIRTGC